MTKADYIALLINGAFYNTREKRLYHPSFKQGWRNTSNVNSFWCALNELGRKGIRMRSNNEPHILKIR